MIITGPERNPYHENPHAHPKLLAVAEVPLAMAGLKRSMQQRHVTVETAQEWLDQAVEIGKDSKLHDVFPPCDTAANIHRKIGAGFATSVFGFTTATGNWALKIGAKNAPVPGWLNPSSKEYALWYARNIDILKETYDDTLPQVVPWPQHILHAENQGQQTTLIIQPEIPSLKKLSSALMMDSEVRAGILDELEAFYAGAEQIRRQHGIIPDLGSNDNLVLTEEGGDHHLKLIDNGLIDFSSSAPVMSVYNSIRYHHRLRHMIKKLKKASLSEDKLQAVQ